MLPGYSTVTDVTLSKSGLNETVKWSLHERSSEGYKKRSQDKLQSTEPLHLFVYCILMPNSSTIMRAIILRDFLRSFESQYSRPSAKYY